MKDLSQKQKLKMFFWTLKLKVTLFLKDMFGKDSEFLISSKKRH